MVAAPPGQACRRCPSTRPPGQVRCPVLLDVRLVHDLSALNDFGTTPMRRSSRNHVHLLAQARSPLPRSKRKDSSHPLGRLKRLEPMVNGPGRLTMRNCATVNLAWSTQNFTVPVVCPVEVTWVTAHLRLSPARSTAENVGQCLRLGCEHITTSRKRGCKQRPLRVKLRV